MCSVKFLNEKERMGISFKVAKSGTRYRPKLLQFEDKEIDNDPTTDSQYRENEGDLVGLGDKVTDYSHALAKPGLRSVSEVPEVSFSLNLFPSGFSVGKPYQLFDNIPKQLHPYDRASEILFCAIESGCLPGDIFDDLPCKYVNGALLCEIKDYRNIFSQKGDTASSAENSPVIYKKVLQMCMESVVKDISLVSDDSWTYNDLLEFESRILKALRPDLHLDPKPMLDRFCEEPLAEKLNLGISWNRKKRKLNDASTIDQVSSYLSPRFQVSEVCAPRNSNIQSDVEFQDRVQYSKLVSSSITTSQRNYVLQENMSQSSLLTSQANYQLAVTYNQFPSGALTPSNTISAHKPNHGNTDPRIPSSLTLGERRRYGIANRGPISEKPNQEPLDFSEEQLPEFQAETKLAIELQRKNKRVHQRIEAEGISHERIHEKMHPSLSRKNGQQAILEGIPKPQPEMLTFRKKEEPIEFGSFPSLNDGNAKDNSHIMDMRNDQSNLLQSQLLPLSVPANAMQWNHMTESIGKNITNEKVVTQGQKGKALPHSLVSSGDVNASVHSCLDNSLPKEAPLRTKRKSNSLLKGSMQKVETLAGTSAMNTANTVYLPVGTPLPWPSVLDDPVLETPMLSGISDPVLDRISKVKTVTQRYALNNRKRKFSQVIERKFFSCTAQLVASGIMNSEDKNFGDGNSDTTSHLDCSSENNHNLFKTRNVTFIRSYHVSQGNDIANSEAQNKLTILEKLDEGIVEATVIYDQEKFDRIELHLLETFTNTHHADLFASQFSSLMMREGYHLAGDRIESAPLVIDESSTSQQQTVTTTATPAAEQVELVPPTLAHGKFPYTFNPMNSSVSTYNPRKLPSQNNFSGNFNSALPVSAGCFSNPPLEIASHIMNKRAFSQLQMMRRYRLQQHLLKKTRMMEEFGAATGYPGTMQLGDGAQGLGNIDLNSFGSIVGTGGTQAAVLGRMRTSENGGRAFNE
ncbi:protein PHYTOCHROME-DEPENDENT LATE-FLOWERING-like isoform X2 [Camellia sinensis]|uniref:protein PHYTOCHROME-DEPENDENT LATE-FLOWERING-like isoform X2 n=1 Tax=Camellia sinensis TaxID=4442 RepID=UPI001035E28F|nr:protein PHYTOCHROME-DEPENDENT LATE-FLOWERING-like isoform X2 [Camellia sinensis]